MKIKKIQNGQLMRASVNCIKIPLDSKETAAILIGTIA